MASQNLMEFNDDNFHSEVLESDKAVLVDFWAPWCGPCRMVGPVIEEIAEQFAGKAVVGKLNVDDNTAMQQKYNIMTIPTVMVFKNGKVVENAEGVQPAEHYANMIQKNL